MGAAKYLEEETGIREKRTGVTENSIAQGKSYADAVRGYEGSRPRKTEGQSLNVKTEHVLGRYKIGEELKQSDHRQAWKIKNREAEWADNEETWLSGNDYDEGTEGNNEDEFLKLAAEDDENDGDKLEQGRKDNMPTAISDYEAEFESQRARFKAGQDNRIDRLSHKLLVEEDSIEVDELNLHTY
ncbi:hypothetical protein SLEP1_g51243 [Rubroshorea leprosula]|uniref:Uncharacterized protein n=1 Tax=Rubroshorea leprosula TaxID=152421 RepID=A0AAV5M2J8_9ROSI|nr:hypothetical protein SLEP1_g51243 [Rubroshorea leprosula]